MSCDPESTGSQNSRRPSATFAGDAGLSAGSGTVSGSATNGCDGWSCGCGCARGDTAVTMPSTAAAPPIANAERVKPIRRLEKV